MTGLKIVVPMDLVLGPTPAPVAPLLRTSTRLHRVWHLVKWRQRPVRPRSSVRRSMAALSTA